MKEQNHPNVIKIRNAHVHNLKHIDVDIPLNKIVGIAGVSGSGKSSLALGVLYAEGSRSTAYSGGTGITPKTGGSGNPEYVWNRIGTVEHITTDIFKTCKSLLSQWPLSGTHT